MKTLKSKGKCLIALVMAVIMLAGVCLPAAAWSVGEDDEGLCYTLSYKDGMLSLVIDAEMLYEVMKDKSITKDELDRFLPSDVIDTLQKGGELSPEDLTSLISSYITVNDVQIGRAHV